MGPQAISTESGTSPSPKGRNYNDPSFVHPYLESIVQAILGRLQAFLDLYDARMAGADPK